MALAIATSDAVAQTGPAKRLAETDTSVRQALNQGATSVRVIIQTAQECLATVQQSLKAHGDVIVGEHASIGAFTAVVHASDVINAIAFATANKQAFGIDAIDLSLGHPIYEPAATDPLVQAVELAVRAGIVVVASAGNFGVNQQTGQTGYAGMTSPGNAPSACREVARIVQEALFNVRKHARARNAVVRLAACNGSYDLDIDDDGVGFDFAGCLSEEELDRERRGIVWGDHIVWGDNPLVIKERVRRIAGRIKDRLAPRRWRATADHVPTSPGHHS